MVRRRDLLTLTGVGAALWVGRWAARVVAAYAARHWAAATQTPNE